jgi:ribonuclease BN (tRNA processing enzyme)
MTSRVLPRASIIAVVIVATAAALRAQTPVPGARRHSSSKTKIVFLGTGNPAPNPEKFGPALAIVVNGTSYLVDAGVGVVRRAAAANRAGVKGLEMPNLKTVFLTHLHSDHTIGLPDLIETPWIMHRTAPLEVYGPAGTAAMMSHIVQAWSADNDIRINGLEHGNTTGNKVNAHEIMPGVIYQDSNVRVVAFLVKHGSWPQAFGYRFETPDRTIVISGDTSPSESVVANCHGCDVLIHEVYSQDGYDKSPADWRAYITSFHTSTYELAALATEAKPRMLILDHQMFFGGKEDTEASMLGEIKSRYKGSVVSAHDLDVY